MGYKMAAEEIGVDLEITGIDNCDQPNYPFYFERSDAMTFLRREYRYFTHIHASPPCQAFTRNSNEKRKSKNSGYLSNDVRVFMYETGLPGVIENVVGSPLVRDIELEGRMFGLKVIRKRIFETVNWFALKPGFANYTGQVNRGELVECTGHGRMKNRQGIRWKTPGTTVREVRSIAMGIDWMTVSELTQAIPPAYTHWIGLSFLKQVKNGI
jgi:DNA (cytosine-5)-methyltransferase 1